MAISFAENNIKVSGKPTITRLEHFEKYIKAPRRGKPISKDTVSLLRALFVKFEELEYSISEFSARNNWVLYNVLRTELEEGVKSRPGYHTSSYAWLKNNTPYTLRSGINYLDSDDTVVQIGCWLTPNAKLLGKIVSASY